MHDKGLILRKNRELEAILEVSRVLTSSFDLEDNLTSVMNILATRLEMQRGCVFLLDPGTKGLWIAAAHGLSSEEIRRGKYKIGEGIVGRVMESRTPMFVPDIGEEPRFLNRTGSRPEKSGVSFLSIPIGLKGEVLGVISADRIYSEEHGGVDDDLRVLSIVASLIAQFVKLWENYRRAEEESEVLRSQLKDRYSFPNIIGESERFQAVLKTVHKVAGTDATVLLLGESGTGKELIASTLHFQSRRAKGPFVAVNCAALPENLLEVELFGAEKGAFTGATSRRAGRFELAEGGTVFLDEVAELPLALQPKLLRVLQERTFEPLGSSMSKKADVRIIAATNRNLEAEARMGMFREDLYWRLNVVPIVLPSLRDRKKDIPLLVSHYIKRFGVMYRKNPVIEGEALEALCSYNWPGNVRELANTLERLVIMAEGEAVSKSDLPYNIIHAGVIATSPAIAPDAAPSAVGFSL
ncbi:MAG: sigma 54-interacting transcriptional regulator [Thermodesulfovibrionales bacterium]|nr:sigma 54-interacting transcriptional regulator [Thermodesulfovibrionales bacterium]